MRPAALRSHQTIAATIRKAGTSLYVAVIITVHIQGIERVHKIGEGLKFMLVA